MVAEAGHDDLPVGRPASEEQGEHSGRTRSQSFWSSRSQRSSPRGTSLLCHHGITLRLTADCGAGDNI